MFPIIESSEATAPSAIADQRDQWTVSATQFAASWHVTATLLVDDLDSELTYHSTFGPIVPKPVAPVAPSFFSMLESMIEAKQNAEETLSFAE